MPAGVGVIVGTDGKLGTVVSSERFKDSIKPMDKASEAILALKPVTFHYKHELDPEAIPQFGLVAEEVEKVNPDLVARDEQRKPYTVRYEAVNAMLLNEFLKEHRKVEQLEATVANLVTTVKEQASEMQKFRAQLEASKSAPQVVNNPERLPDRISNNQPSRFTAWRLFVWRVEIRPFRNGWKVYESAGVEPVFLTQEQAISYAQGRACFRAGEIRVLDSNGNIERIIPFSESDRKL